MRSVKDINPNYAVKPYTLENILKQAIFKHNTLKDDYFIQYLEQFFYRGNSGLKFMISEGGKHGYVAVTYDEVAKLVHLYLFDATGKEIFAETDALMSDIGFEIERNIRIIFDGIKKKDPSAENRIEIIEQIDILGKTYDVVYDNYMEFYTVDALFFSDCLRRSSAKVRSFVIGLALRYGEFNIHTDKFPKFWHLNCLHDFAEELNSINLCLLDNRFIFFP